MPHKIYRHLLSMPTNAMKRPPRIHRKQGAPPLSLGSECCARTGEVPSNTGALADGRLDETSDCRDSSARRKAERLAARWKPDALAGPGGCRELFCVPILIAFAQDIPESHVELALGVAAARQAMSKVLQQEMQDRRLQPLIVLEDLFPMREMGRASLEQARTAVRAESLAEFRAVASDWSRSADAPLMLSPAYAFFLVGLHERDHRPRRHQDDTQLEALNKCISTLVHEAIGVRPSVRVGPFGSFFDGIREGTWQYRETRLAQMARRDLNRVGTEEPAILHMRAEVPGRAAGKKKNPPRLAPGGSKIPLSS